MGSVTKTPTNHQNISSDRFLGVRDSSLYRYMIVLTIKSLLITDNIVLETKAVDIKRTCTLELK